MIHLIKCMHLEHIRAKQGGLFGRYFFGIVIIIFVFIVANIPHMLAMVYEVGLEQLGSMDTAEQLKILPSNKNLVLMLFPFAVVTGLILLLVRKLHKLSIVEFITSRKKIDWKRFGFAFFSITFLTSLLFVGSYISNPNDFQLNFDAQAFAVLFVIAIVMVPLQTSAEELFFRGYLMQGLGQVFTKRLIPLLITSLLFGYMHYSNPEVEKLGPLLMVSYVSTGFFLGIITLMDEGLELALGFHAGNNLLISLLVTADWTAFQTHSIFLDVSEPNVYMYAFMSLPVYALLLFVYSKKYGWSNWKQKLLGRPTT